MCSIFVICALLVAEASSSAVFDPPPSNSTVLEGGTATFTCVPKEDGSIAIAVWIISPVGSAAVTVFPGNATTLPGADQVIQSANRTQLTITGVQRSLDGASVECRGILANPPQLTAPLVYIVVQRPPNFTLPELSRDVLEGQALSLTLEKVDFGNSEGAASVLFEGRVLSEGSGFTVSRSGSTWSLEFLALKRSDAGVYRVILSNTVGSSEMNYTVNVVYPPEYTVTFPTVRSVQLNSGSLFTFNCTASAANPSSVDYRFHVNGSSQPFSISGSALAISSVVRANTGNYSCTVTNTAGSTTLYYNLLIVAPPTSPLNLMVSGEMAFSAMVTWTPPTDDGGISHPSWTQPLVSQDYISYTVTYSNSSGSWSINNLNTPLVTLSNLQHSTDYTVTVAASNAHGQGTGVQGTFRTSDSKPILQAVVLAPLSLNNFTANVTFLTVGGQNVTSFSIRVNGTIVEGFTSESVAGDDKNNIMVSLLIEDQSFTKGTYYSVEITATNSINTSEPITGLMFVPNAPNVTGTFTEVPAGSIPSTKCCAGVQLMLADRVVLSDLNVVLTPTVPSVSLELQDFTLYIGGIQAGTDYTALVTVSIIFGSSPEHQLLLKPLLGIPSKPNPPTVSVNGGQVTVELSTAYPGTVQTRSGSMFRFEIQFIKEEQCSSRQSKNVTYPVTPQSLATIRAYYVDNLDPGSYSVSVTAINEHGRSSAVKSDLTFTVQAPSSVDTVTIVLVVIIVVQFLLLVAMVIGCVIFVVSHKLKRGGSVKSEDSSDDKKSPTAEPVYAETEMGGGNHGDIALQSNVAYGTIEAGTKPPPPPQPTQSAPGGLGSEYEVVDTKKEERKKIVEGEQYSNFTVL